VSEVVDRIFPWSAVFAGPLRLDARCPTALAARRHRCGTRAVPVSDGSSPATYAVVLVDDAVVRGARLQLSRTLDPGYDPWDAGLEAGDHRTVLVDAPAPDRPRVRERAGVTIPSGDVRGRRASEVRAVQLLV
jgi:hypothetical protein